MIFILFKLEKNQNLEIFFLEIALMKIFGNFENLITKIGDTTVYQSTIEI